MLPGVRVDLGLLPGLAERPVVAEPDRINPHRAASISGASIVRDPHQSPHLFEGTISLVLEQKISNGIVGNDDINPTITVDIDGSDSHRFAQRNVGVFVSNLDTSGL